MTDLRTRDSWPARRSSASFTDLASPLAAELLRPRRLRLGHPRPRARRRDRSRPARPTLRGRARRRSPRSSDRSPPSGCASGARSISGRAGIMLPQLDSRPTQVREAVSYLRYPPDGVRGRGAADPRRRHGRARPRRRRRAINERIVGIIQIESPSAVERRRRDRRASRRRRPVRRARPTCRTPGRPGPFDDPAYLDALGRVVGGLRAARQGGRHPALRRGVAARHLELGFRFIGLGSEGAFVSAGAKAMLAPPGRRPADRPASATRPRRRPAGARSAAGPVWAITTPTRMNAAADELDRRQALAENRSRGQDDDRPDRLDRADERRLGRPDPPGPGVERLDREERRDEPDADQAGPGAGRDRPAGPARPVSERASRVDRRGRGHHQAVAPRRRRRRAVRRRRRLRRRGPPFAGEPRREDDPDRVDDRRQHDQPDADRRRRRPEVDPAERRARPRRARCPGRPTAAGPAGGRPNRSDEHRHDRRVRCRRATPASDAGHGLERRRSTSRHCPCTATPRPSATRTCAASQPAEAAPPRPADGSTHSQARPAPIREPPGRAASASRRRPRRPAGRTATPEPNPAADTRTRAIPMAGGDPSPRG